MIRRTLAVFGPIVLLVACSSPASSGEASQGGAASMGESAPAAESTGPGASVGVGGGDGLATVDLTITGGDYAGTYHVDITEGGCSTGATGADQFAVASVVVDPDEAFDGPQITIYDQAAAASGTDTEFSAAFTFNGFAYTSEVNPKISRGTGTATLDNRGSTATLTIEGTGFDGETVNATIECHTVTNF